MNGKRNGVAAGIAVTGVVVATAALLVLVPAIDLVVSGWFFDPAGGFVLRYAPLPEFLHDAIQILSRLLGVALAGGLLLTLSMRRPILGLGGRQWLFLLAALVVGPGLVANTVFKDHWGRARPAQVEAFSGTRQFTPPLIIADQCRDNCSFVAGDPASGFYLHSFAYVVAPSRRRAVLAGGLAAGGLAGLLRIGMGAHFFSDVVFAGLFMVLTTAVLHAALFGAGATRRFWRALASRRSPA